MVALRPRGSAHEQSLNPWTRRRVLCWTLFVLAGVMAVNHLVAHAGTRILPLGMGKQDIFLGYPMAALLALSGLIALDPRPKL